MNIETRTFIYGLLLLLVGIIGCILSLERIADYYYQRDYNEFILFLFFLIVDLVCIFNGANKINKTTL